MLRGREHLLQLLLTEKIPNLRENTHNWEKEDLLRFSLHPCALLSLIPVSYDSSLSAGPLYSLLALAPLTSHGNIPFRRRIRKRYTLLEWKLAAHPDKFMSFPSLCPDAPARSRQRAQPGRPRWKKGWFVSYGCWRRHHLWLSSAGSHTSCRGDLKARVGAGIPPEKLVQPSGRSWAERGSILLHQSGRLCRDRPDTTHSQWSEKIACAHSNDLLNLPAAAGGKSNTNT